MNCRLATLHFAYTTQNRRYNQISVIFGCWNVIVQCYVSFSIFVIQEFTFGKHIVDNIQHSVNTLHHHTFTKQQLMREHLWPCTLCSMCHTVCSTPCAYHVLDCICENRTLQMWISCIQYVCKVYVQLFAFQCHSG